VVEVREATQADTESIVELTAAGWRAAYPGIVPAERIENLPIAGWRHDIRSGLRAPKADSFTRIAEAGGEVVGYSFVAAPGREEPEASRVAEVVAVYVDPERWRTGVGRALMGSVDEGAAQAGYEELVLWSFEQNERALAFYDALGWEREDLRRPHRASGASTIRLRHSLRSQ
jgi:GNAT superfamily N-acetyltransferase